jgi:hypothetical protein
MKTSRITAVLVLVCCASFVLVGSNWLGHREARAGKVPTPPPEDPLPRESVLGASATPSMDREAPPPPEPVVEPRPAVNEAPEVANHYVFLPEELQALGTLVPQRLAEFDSATPAEQVELGRDLLVHSLAVIMCATGTGPIPKGMVGDGDLSHTGRDGKWSFQINNSTFHFYDSECPEYREYMAVYSKTLVNQMVPLATMIELPAHVAESIRQRAQEALGWL